jgi:hypothetical protein
LFKLKKNLLKKQLKNKIQKKKKRLFNKATFLGPRKMWRSKAAAMPATTNWGGEVNDFEFSSSSVEPPPPVCFLIQNKV